MAIPKLCAFYKSQANREWQKCNRWELINLSEDDYKRVKSERKFHLRPQDNSPPLTFNRRQKTFRFFPSTDIKRDTGKNNMTISHLLAQEVLAEQRALVFDFGELKEYLSIKVRKGSITGFLERPVIARGNKYYMDVVKCFDDPTEQSYKWGSYFCIEVFVTHEVSFEKLHDCMHEGVPLIEVKIPDKLIVNKSLASITEKEEKSLKNSLREYFSKKIPARLLVDPVCEKYQRDQIIQKKVNTIDKLENRNEFLEKDNRRLLEGQNFMQDQAHKDELKINELSEHLRELTEANLRLRNRMATTWIKRGIRFLLNKVSSTASNI